MFNAKTQIRVRYAETDQMGYVYYGNYATYFEVARVETLRDLGFSYKEMEKIGVMMPVLESKIKYIKPGLYDELLTIQVKIPTFPKVRIVFEYEVINDSNQLITIAETTLAFVDMKSGRPCKMPAPLEKLMIPFFQ